MIAVLEEDWGVSGYYHPDNEEAEEPDTRSLWDKFKEWWG